MSGYAQGVLVVHHEDGPRRELDEARLVVRRSVHGRSDRIRVGVMAEPHRYGARAHRTSDDITLTGVATHVRQALERGSILDAFRDRIQSERVREIDGRADDGRRVDI